MLPDALVTKDATNLLSNCSGANRVESCMEGSANSSDCFHSRLLEKTSSTGASQSITTVEVECEGQWGMTPKAGRGSGPWRLPRLFPQRVRDFRISFPSSIHSTIFGHASAQEDKSKRSFNAPRRHPAKDTAGLWARAIARRCPQRCVGRRAGDAALQEHDEVEADGYDAQHSYYVFSIDGSQAYTSIFA